MPAAERPGPSRHRTPRAASARTRRNRRELLVAARRMVGAEGASIPLARIAAAAGSSEPAVHRHFGNRAGLLALLLAEEAGYLRRAVRAGVVLHAGPASSAAEQLAAITRSIAATIDRRPVLAALLAPDPSAGGRVRTLAEELGPIIEPVLGRGQALRTIDPQVRAVDLLWGEALLRGAPPDVALRLRGALGRGLAPARPVLRSPTRRSHT